MDVCVASKPHWNSSEIPILTMCVYCTEQCPTILAGWLGNVLPLASHTCQLTRPSVLAVHSVHSVIEPCGRRVISFLRAKRPYRRLLARKCDVPQPFAPSPASTHTSCSSVCDRVCSDSELQSARLVRSASPPVESLGWRVCTFFIRKRNSSASARGRERLCV